jgi:PAS domain S-box-containing protein
MGYSEYLAALVASVLISGTLAMFFWHRHPAPGARVLAGLAGMITIWSLGYIVEVITGTPSGFLLANYIEYIGFVSVPVFWLLFTMEYTGYQNRLMHNRWWLFIIPSITLLLVWTNNVHGWMWFDTRLETFGEFVVQTKTYGPWFWVHTLYSYALMLAGISIITIRLFYPHHLFRNQVITMLFAIFIPLIWNIIYVFRAAPTYHVDMTPPAFVISGLIIAFGLFRFNILKIVPVARNQVVDNMEDGVIVMDNQNLILDYNRAAKKIIRHLDSNVIGTPANRILPEFSEWTKHVGDDGKFQTEITIDGMYGQSHYELCLTSLQDRNKNPTGKVITFHDITERKKSEEALATANKQLKQYAKKITEVQEEERKRIAYELHDDTAQYLSILKMQIGSLADSGEIRNSKVKEKLQYLERDADRAFNDVRRYSHELRPVILEHHGLTAALEQIADDYDRLGQLNIEIQLRGDEPELPEEVKLGFFRIAQEALNNIRKHAKTTKAVISLKYERSGVDMEVSDKGTGFDVEEASNRSSGKGSLGLMSMRERAALINADFEIESEVGKGTKVILKARI